MYCTACGTKNASENNFCKQCGHKLDRIAPVKISEDEFDRALPPEEQVVALLDRAYRLRKDGDLAASIALCEEALRLRPDSASAHSLLGQIYEAKGERERAVREYERVLQLNPGSIADRVKLDELRSETPAPLRKTTPHIVFAEPPSGGRFDGGRLLPTLAAAGVLLLVGAVFGQQWRSSRANTPVPAPTASNLANSNVGPHSTSVPVGPVPVATLDTGSAQSVQKPPQTAPFHTEVPLITQNPSSHDRNAANPYSPISYGNLPQKASNLPVITNDTPPKQSKTHPAAQPTRKVSSPEESQNRVRLSDGDDGVTSEGNGKYVVKISGAKGNTSKSSEKEADGSAHIQLSTPPDKTGTPAPAITADPPAPDARDYMATANDLKMKEQYSKAVGFYRKAIPQAGDETAYVYQQIALCYQDMGNHASAKTYFQNAISAYHKLESAGRLTEERQNGLRNCERGLKSCE